MPLSLSHFTFTRIVVARPMSRIIKPPIPGFLSIQTIAKRLEVSSRTVERWIARGELAAHKFGGAVRVSEDDLQQMIVRSRQIRVDGS